MMKRVYDDYVPNQASVSAPERTIGGKVSEPSVMLT